MFTVYSFQTAGTCHDSDINNCQDFLQSITDPDLTTIVLCDGAGSSPYGGIAARETAGYISRHLHNNFEQYLHEDSLEIKKRIAFGAENNLQKTARRLHINPHMLATTIVAMSIDSFGNILGIHLGDGSICCSKDDRLLMVSSPQYQPCKKAPYLTMNCVAYYHMKFYRWKDSEVTQIILLSDGMEQLQDYLNYEFLTPKNLITMNRIMMNTESTDDMSYIMCNRQI